MTKAQLQAVVQAKVGFHSIISDELAPDNKAGDPIEKRFFYINHLNADATMGKTFIYYLLDIVGDIASFYNVEPESVDTKELSIQAKKFLAVENYLKTTFAFYFPNRSGSHQNTVWLEADVYTDGVSLTKTTIIASRVGLGAVTHKTVI